METNKSIVPLNHHLSQLEKQIEIGDKLLNLENSDSDKIKLFLINITLKLNSIPDVNLDYNFNAFLFLSKEYYLSFELIHKYHRYWNFTQLSSNTKIFWCEDIIDYYLKYWDWKTLSSNEGLPWSIDFIECYVDYWDWEVLSANEKLPWDYKFLSRYLDKWNFNTLSDNKGITWDKEMITIIEPCSEHSLGGYHKDVCENNFLKVNDKYVNVDYKPHFKINYFDRETNVKLDFVIDKEICWDCLSNHNIELNLDLLKKHQNEINWYLLSRNTHIKLSDKIINIFIDEWNWDDLSSNENLPWSIPFIENFKEYWNWEYLSYNKSIPWSEELIDKFEGFWNWEWLNSLSVNPSLPWSIDFAKKYKDRIDWDSFSYYNEGDFWSEEFLEEFKDKIELWRISINRGFPWSIKKIDNKIKYACSDWIHPTVVKEILPHLNDNVIEEIMQELIKPEHGIKQNEI